MKGHHLLLCIRLEIKSIESISGLVKLVNGFRGVSPAAGTYTNSPTRRCREKPRRDFWPSGQNLHDLQDETALSAVSAAGKLLASPCGHAAASMAWRAGRAYRRISPFSARFSDIFQGDETEVAARLIVLSIRQTSIFLIQI